MDITIPTVLKALSVAGSGLKAFTAWGKKAKGDSRSLISELRDNLTYLDMVSEDGVDLGDVIAKISISEYKRLDQEGFNFNSLKKGKITKYPSLRESDLASWGGKETEELVKSIYEKINQLKLRYPHVQGHSKYKWSIRVNNNRKRIWLLLKHVSS